MLPNLASNPLSTIGTSSPSRFSSEYISHEKGAWYSLTNLSVRPSLTRQCQTKRQRSANSLLHQLQLLTIAPLTETEQKFEQEKTSSSSLSFSSPSMCVLKKEVCSKSLLNCECFHVNLSQRTCRKGRKLTVWSLPTAG